MHRPDQLFNRLGKFLLIPLALLAFAGAGYSVWSTKAWLARAVEVPGSVIEMVRLRDRDDGGYRFTPLVRFKTADGTTIEFQSTVSTNPPAYRSGQTVAVLYDPDAPHSAAIRGFLTLWFLPMVLSFFGIVTLIIGMAMVVISARVARAFDRPAKAA